MRLFTGFLLAALLGGPTSPAWATDEPKGETRERSGAEVGRDLGGRVGGAVDEASKSARDAWISAKVKTELLADPLVRAMNIDVDTVDGIVTLTGVVPTERARQRALEDTRATRGVRQVVDGLVVGSPPADRKK